MSKNITKHTPTLVRGPESPTGSIPLLDTDTGWIIGRVAVGHRDWGALIVRAVNAYEQNERKIEAMREALENAERGAFYAWQMFCAIYENDPSIDRKRARDRTAENLSKIRAALALAEKEPQS